MSTAPKSKPPSPMRAMVIHHTVTALTIAGILALGVWGYLSYRNNQGFFYEGKVEARSPLDEALIGSQQDRIKLAVRAFFEVHDNYPATLNELVNEGWLTQSDLSYPNGKTSYKMKINAEEVTILATDDSPSADKDGKTAASEGADEGANAAGEEQKPQTQDKPKAKKKTKPKANEK